MGGGDEVEAVALRYEDGDVDCEPTYFQDLDVCMGLITDIDTLLALPAEEDEKKTAPEAPVPSPSTSHSPSPPESVVPICRCEWNKVHLLPTVGADAEGVAAKVKKLTAVLDVYQQLPHLLHPHLEALLPPLLRVLQRFLPSAVEIWSWEEAEKRKSKKNPPKNISEKSNNTAPPHVPVAEGEKAVDSIHEEEEEEEEEDPHHLIITSALGQNFSIFDDDAPKEGFHWVARALYTIIKTAGEKACTSYFPNDVRHYEDVFYTLRWWARSPLRQREWEVRYCLLLWLSNLVLVPFSMHLFDTSMVSRARRRYSAFSAPSSPLATTTTTRCSPPASPSFSLEEGASLEEATLITAVTFLQDSTKCKDAAALLVARLLTRPDSKHQRDVFFRFTNDIVRCVAPTKRCPGYLWDGLHAMLATSSITCSLLVPFFHPTASGPVRCARPSFEDPPESLKRETAATLALHSEGSTEAKKDNEKGKAALLSQCFLPGVLLAVAKTMKVAAREEVVRYSSALMDYLAEDLWDPLHHPTDEGEEGEEKKRLAAALRDRGDSLLVKLCVKVVQRLMLSMLPNRRAAWKYSRASPAMNLAANLSVGGGGGVPARHPSDPTHAPPPEEDGAVEEKKEEEEEAAAKENEAEEDSDTTNEDMMDEETLEYGIGILLEALGHSDTIVRWSAAKGVGRLCDRLPQPMAIDVLTAVLDLLRADEHGNGESAYNDRLWHGGTLAVAELCRRGLLLQDTLAVAVPLIEKGLCYDVAKGTYSVGAHVRDAAAYTCWSMARAYDPADLTSHVHGLSGALVATSLLDREVNVRRAASAAFQECVGRLGHFPHGISLCTMMDFFALSSLSQSYVHVTPRVAVFKTYRHKLVEVLVTEKLVHWDRHVREVAAEALGRVARLEVYGVNAEEEEEEGVGKPHSPEDAVSGAAITPSNCIFNEVFPELLNRVTDTMVATRHGAILGIVALVRHLPTEALASYVDDIIRLIPRLDAARLFRSRGGEYVRGACCQLLEAIARHPLPIPDVIPITKMNGTLSHVKTLGKLQEFLEDSWASILDWMQRAASHAFRRFAAVYYAPFRPAFHGKILHKLFASLSNESIPLLQRRGSIAALGGVPLSFLLASPTHWQGGGEKSSGAASVAIKRGEPHPLSFPLRTSGAEKEGTIDTRDETKPETASRPSLMESDDTHQRIPFDKADLMRGVVTPSYGVLVVALLSRLAIPPLPNAPPPPTAAAATPPPSVGADVPQGSTLAPGKTPCTTTRPQEEEEEAAFEALYSGWDALATLLATPLSGTTAAEAQTASLASPAQVRTVLENTASDPECRRNAVVALCQVFTAVPQNSFSVQEATTTGETGENEEEEEKNVVAWHPVNVEAVVAKKVVRTLLMALEDYATDHRGDIGSIVRLAVLEGLPAVTLHAIALMSSVDGGGTHDRTAPAPSLVVEILRGVLRGLFGKLDRVRECAGKVLEVLFLQKEATTSLLYSACREEEKREIRRLHTFLRRLQEQPPPPRASPLSSSPSQEQGEEERRRGGGGADPTPTTTAALSEEVGVSATPLLPLSTPKDGDDKDMEKIEEEEEEKKKKMRSGPPHTGVKWRSPQWMEWLCPFLLCHTPQCFAEAVMDGVVTSAGDLTVYIRKPAEHALRVAFSGEYETLEEEKEEKEEDDRRPCSSPAGTAARETTSWNDGRALSVLLVRVGVRHRHAERMVSPLSRVIDMLLTGQFLAPAVHGEVVDFLRQEMKYFATTIRPLLVMIPLLGSLCRSPSPEARTQAWMLGLTMIASRYPRVRSGMASELYTALLSLVAVCSNVPKQEKGGTLEEEKKEEWLHAALPISEERCREAMEHLQRTAWDAADVTAVRRARLKLYPMLGLTPPPVLAGGGAKRAAPAPPKREIVASTYQSLVDEAGY